MMRNLILRVRWLLGCLALATLAAVTGSLSAGASQVDHPRVLLETTEGRILVELDPQKAPISVRNFLRYVDEGHYDQTIFHRVIDGFMIQGGGFTADFTRKPTHDPIQNEADNGLQNLAGTLAFARTPDPHSATAQFFINTVDNHFLDHRSKTSQGWGYTVFGRVVDGMDTVRRIAGLPTGRGGPIDRDVPQKTVTIEKAVVVERADASDAEPPGSIE